MKSFGSKVNEVANKKFKKEFKSKLVGAHVYERNKVWDFYEPKSKEHEEYGLIRKDIYRMTRYDENLLIFCC